MVSVFGDFLALFAVFSLISFRLHGTPTQITLILISFILPLAVVGPVAGVFVDRWDVKRTMIASDLIRAVLAVLLIFARQPYQIYVLLLALSTVSSFFLPAQSVTVRTIVPKEGLMAANALISQAFQVMQIISPAIAGALVALLGERSCFYLDAISFVFSALMLSTLTVSREPSTGGKSLSAIYADLTSGMKFIFTHSTMSFVILSMTTGMFAIRCFSALIAVYVRDLLKATAVLFGMLSSMVGVGMIVGTQVVTRLARRHSKRHLVIAGLLGISVSIFLLGAVVHTVVTLLTTLVMGFSVALILIPAQTVMQEETPPAMLGRVSSSFMSVLSFAQIAALGLSGPVAEWIGIRHLYYASAMFLFLIAAFGYWRIKKQTSTP